MTSPALSICIPTHDGRAGQLDRALTSIAEQFTEALRADVEVVVSDNGSRDGTRDVVARWRETLGENLVYHRFEENVGFTRNLLRVIDTASGRYCWILGSDDWLEPAAISTVLSALGSEHGVTGATVNRVHVDASTLEETLDDPRALPPPGRHRYTDARSIFADLALLQDFISAQIVHRERWRRAAADIGDAGIARGMDFPHLPIIFAMIRDTPSWLWVETPLIRHSVGLETLGAFGSDAYSHALLVNSQRARIFADEFGKLSSLNRDLMYRAWVLQANTFAVIHLKYQPGGSPARTWRLAKTMARAYWFLPDFWLRSAPPLVVPVPLMRLAGRVLRAVARATGRSPDAVGPQPPATSPYRSSQDASPGGARSAP
jgi:abequosyltransferase